MTDMSSAQWFKSSHSMSAQTCVEVAAMGQGIFVRDSKDPAGPVLSFSCRSWQEFADCANSETSVSALSA
ncbi:DUF397 domain-containing protein [Streptomyces sp. NPDC002889]|uniref:DUF397 domain-containing protein n=1 Tax=Streptomyces sp. NPDC002889 TaxID=3364669 RepID=UPI00369F16D9